MKTVRITRLCEAFRITRVALVAWEQRGLIKLTDDSDRQQWRRLRPETAYTIGFALMLRNHGWNSIERCVKWGRVIATRGRNPKPLMIYYDDISQVIFAPPFLNAVFDKVDALLEECA